ncbi:peptidoglycan bridge formation glycyltransferase FemA/FemB family protein [Treponema primitia]|uniref:lipid II:glycine glycyltransferase FemX n=1 Tax=Treponema primitia TaxID=88058 RepID=UPI00397EBD5F
MPASETNVLRKYRGIASADLARCNKAASFLQSGFWGSFKARFGWNARSFLVSWEGGGDSIDLPLLVIRRPLAFGISFAYVPWGPELPPDFFPGDSEKNELLRELALALKSLLPENTAFIRFDPPWYTAGAETPAPPIYPPFSRSAADVQPPDTVLVDLRPPEADILRGMKPKWRYNIKLAEKRGVQVRHTGAEELDTFYTLFRETAKRDGISIHSIGYYQTLFAHCAGYPGQELRLYLAEYKGKTLAANIVLFRNSIATYLYGASSNEERNRMASYALQWKAMADAKALGCTQYDLFGIPPNADTKHPMAGLYLFKTGFGGRIIHRPGSWDFTYKPLVRRVFSAAEALRKGIRTIKKKKRGKNSL